jgi:uncharacterized SAM-binding protein YcdF (DUF218 family)
MRGRFTRMTRIVALGLCAAALVTAGSFLWFLWLVPNDEVQIRQQADGIVVLTGGASRIADALELLASHRGQRLLISGVHRTTSQTEIARLMPEYRKIFDCCVDLDRSALNTVGNAVETRRWAKERGFKTLIVVTSNYHIPRAMAELSHQLPDVTLLPFPVVAHKVDAMWSNPQTARLLFFEYLKYMFAQVRMRLGPAV